MQQHDHVPTTPGEIKAPEYVPDPVRPLPAEEGGGGQSEDINIPLVALMVAFFAVLLLITIFSLEAWFYNSQRAEVLAKQVPQGAPGTPLGDLLSSEHSELYSKEAAWNDHKDVNVTVPPKTKVRIPIDRAMDLTVKQYAAAQGAK